MSTTVQKDDQSNYKYVFVCGLQRSGTSVLARNIGRLKPCTVFNNTGVIENEGQYLQDVYPTNNELGGTGWYGFDPRAHLTHKSDLLTPENVARIRKSWHSYWDRNKSICVEKTPSNLLMTRFLQAAFPNSYFIVIRRHPIAVSLANQRWKKSMASMHKGFDHWLRCHELFEEDKKYLKHLYQLAYEDYVKEPSKYHREIAAFIGSLPVEEGMEEITESHNERYFNRWAQLVTESPFRSYYHYIARKYEPRFASYGYSLTEVIDGGRRILQQGNDIADHVGALWSFGADCHALLWRLATRTKGLIRRQLRRWLPEFLKTRVKRLLRQLRQAFNVAVGLGVGYCNPPV
jgi:hypothetical protein